MNVKLEMGKEGGLAWVAFVYAGGEGWYGMGWDGM
jgi:hypothetical protein